MSRIVKIDSANKERNMLGKLIVYAMRELMTMTEPDEKSKDIAAFIILALREIFLTVETSVAAWEKRGYWLKADRYRLDWEWTIVSSDRLEKSLRKEDWGALAGSLAEVGQKLKNIKIPVRYKPGEPWNGAWNKLK
jgi:hypothetical protein